ncbi:MAG: hypothetical protein JXQ93_07060 [Flavobacteriaceae bacterium]
MIPLLTPKLTPTDKMRCTFNLKNKNKNEKTLIYLKAYFKNEGKKLVYSTGEAIKPSEWDFKNDKTF